MPNSAFSISLAWAAVDATLRTAWPAPSVEITVILSIRLMGLAASATTLGSVPARMSTTAAWP